MGEHMQKKDIIEIITSSLKDIISNQFNEEREIMNDFDESTHLIGEKSILDSLSLVSLLVDVEQKVNSNYGVSITIANERALSQKKSPFRTIKTLASDMSSVEPRPVYLRHSAISVVPVQLIALPCLSQENVLIKMPYRLTP